MAIENNNLNLPIILILGPTGSAKTRIAKLLALNIKGSLINCDAYQIYNHLNIGVNKTDLKDFINPHYLFNIKNPDENYSIQDYQKDSREAIKDSISKGYIPIIVGGNILYALSCICDFKFSKQRSKNSNLDKLDNISLYNLLKKIDPIEAKKIHYNNHQRVIRALEIYYNEGITKTDFNNNQSKDYIYNNLYIFGLNIDIELLKKMLFERIEKQFSAGLVSEVDFLVKKYGKDNLSMKAIGYKEIIYGQQNNLSINEIKALIYKNTYNYAKKQISYLKKIKNIIFINVDINKLDEAVFLIKKSLWQ